MMPDSSREQMIANLSAMLTGLTVYIGSMHDITAIQTFARRGHLLNRRHGQKLDGLGPKEYIPIGWSGTAFGTIVGVSPSSAHPYVAWRRWGARKIGEVNLYNSDVELSPGRQVKIIRVTSESR